jgi:hypothetical protein
MNMKTLIPMTVAAFLTSLSGGLQAAPPDSSQPKASAPRAESSAKAKNLQCRTSFGETGGWVECKGQGTWRALADCQNEPDDSSDWLTQKKGTHRRYVECTFRIAGVSYEVR